MRRSPHFPLLLLLALLLSIVAAAPALAASEAQYRAADVGARLEATGTGVVIVRGRLLTYGLIEGAGRLIVTDFRGDAVVRLDGRLRRIPDSGVLRIMRADGRFYVEGSGVRVRIQGAGLDISVVGRGRAVLIGTGQYQLLNEGPEQDWPGAREPVLLDPPSDGEKPRRR